VSLPSIGVWIAEHAMGGFGDGDCVPENGLRIEAGINTSPEAAVNRVRPWRAYAAVGLWKNFAAIGR
jgi:hypothetical protein